MRIYLRGISSGDWDCEALRSYFRGIFVGNDFRSSVSFGKLFSGNPFVGNQF